MKKWVGLIVGLVCLQGMNAVYAGSGNPLKFMDDIQAFIDMDKENTFPKQGAVLFVGSSSINFWHTAASFPNKAVINRGFGGSQAADLLFHYPHVIGKYNPATVVVYVGSNDVAANLPVDEVVADLQALFARMRGDFPKSKLIYLSNNPSLLRWPMRDRMRAVNAQMKQFTAEKRLTTYVDTAASLLTKEGLPDQRYFRIDGLHLNAKGYQTITKVLKPYL